MRSGTGRPDFDSTKPNNNMKKSEIKHITGTTAYPDKDPELVFTGYILNGGESVRDDSVKPEQWGNVRHLVGNLFYAYDDERPTDGMVYIGKFV